MKEIPFDDFEGLRAEIREEFGDFGQEVEISQHMIQTFADLTGDQQWIHVDVERAKAESPFGGPIAHGFLTLSMLPSVRPGNTFSVTGFGNATNYGSDGLRFLSPVPSGSTIHARARLCDVKGKKHGTLLTTEIAVHVKGDDRPGLLYKSLILYTPRRS